MKDAINKITEAMTLLDENQGNFEKEDVYKKLAEGYQAAYNTLNDQLTTPAVNRPQGIVAAPGLAAQLEQSVRSGLFSWPNLAVRLDHRDDNEGRDEDDLQREANEREAQAVVRAMRKLFTGDNHMSHREAAAAHPIVFNELILRLTMEHYGDYNVPQKAVNTLAVLVHNCPAAKAQFFRQDGLRHVIELLKENEGANSHITHVAELIANLAMNCDASRKLIGDYEDTFDAFVDALNHGDTHQQEKESIADALYHLSDGNAANRKAIREAGAIEPLAVEVAKECGGHHSDVGCCVSAILRIMDATENAMEEDD